MERRAINPTRSNDCRGALYEPPRTRTSNPLISRYPGLNWAQTKGCYDNAQALLKDSLVLINELGYKPEMALILERLAQIAYRQNAPDRAARLFGVEEASCESICFRITRNLPQYNRDVQSIHFELGEEDFAKAWEEGRDMTIDQGIAYALEPG